MRHRVLFALIFSFLTMSAQLPDSLHVGIVTCAPGNDIYQLEGHAALHIQGRYQDRPIDIAVNWGLFPDFVTF